MTSLVVVALLVFGVNTLFWSTVGVMRVVAARWDRVGGRHAAPTAWTPAVRIPTPADVAVLVAAHDEELVIAETIRSAAALVPVANVHVISDGSTDATAAIARAAGAQVLELHPNRGKAGALAAGIEHFDLCSRFEVVLLLDADTHLHPDYLTTGLPLFDAPDVVAVAGRATTITSPAPSTRIGRLLVAYRERVYIAVQYLLKFGQAARRANVVTIVPGFASMYRTRVLRHIDICAPGLVIEDFNMTFEVHTKRLGRIAFHPHAAIAYTQDPDRVGDYVKQVRRWSLGFWQTVRRHRVRPDRFGFALAAYITELVISSIVLLLIAPLALASLVVDLVDRATGAAGGIWDLAHVFPPQMLLLGILLPDYVLTVLAAVVSRRPKYLLLGLAFPLIRLVDAALCLQTIPLARSSRDTGVWRSPARRPRTGPVPAASPVARTHP